MSLSPCEFQTCSVSGRLANSGQKLSFTRERAFAVFALLALLDLAAEELREQLHAVADAQHRHAELEDGLVRQRRVLGINTGRAAGEDDAAWASARAISRAGVS